MEELEGTQPGITAIDGAIAPSMPAYGHAPFSGEFRLTLPANGRIALPATLRRAFVDTAFVRVIGGRFVNLWTPLAFRMVMDQMAAQGGQGLVDPRVRKRAYASSTEVSVDSQGRFVLPPAVRDAVGIATGDEILLAGMIEGDRDLARRPLRRGRGADAVRRRPLPPQLRGPRVVMATDPFVHESVLLDRVLELFAPVPAGTVVDATLGGAGHAAALLEARDDLRVLGLDQDRDALVAAQTRLAAFGDRGTATHARFDQLATVVAAAGAAVQPIVGVLFDLGVSSPQLDRPERGFSYRADGPLDMRQDRDQARTADDLVNHGDRRELARVLRDLGDERFADRIARAVDAARPVTGTLQLAEIVRSAIPAATRRTGGHPAKRTFQALRMWTNDELAVLEAGLDAALAVTAPGGRVVAISFHSGEDRIVKARFRTAETGGCTCPPGLPCVCGARPEARLLKRGGWTPDATELQTNPRAASARVRAVELLPTTDDEVQP